MGAHRRRAGPDGARRFLDGLGDELRAGTRRRATHTGWDPDLGSRRDLPVFIAHGRRDPTIDVAFARRARDVLEAAGLAVTYHEAEAAHHIDPNHIPAATRWLTAATTDQRAPAAATNNSKER